jgi:hypothetical protein
MENSAILKVFFFVVPPCVTLVLNFPQCHYKALNFHVLYTKAALLVPVSRLVKSTLCQWLLWLAVPLGSLPLIRKPMKSGGYLNGAAENPC